MKGNHTLKFGFSAFHTEDYVYYIAAQSNPYGSYTYNTPTAFAEDYSGGASGKNWTSFAQTVRQSGCRLQNQRVRSLCPGSVEGNPRLTINSGLRWDKAPRSTSRSPIRTGPQTAYIHTPNKNFAPRFGLAYRIDDQTVIRGGYGLFYARLLGGLIDDLWTQQRALPDLSVAQRSNSTQLAAGPEFPNALTSPVPGQAASSLQSSLRIRI